MIHAATGLFFSLCKNLSREKTISLGESIGSAFWNLGYRKSVVLKNLDIAFPERDKKWKLSIGKASLQSIGRVLTEFPKLPEYKEKKILTDIFELEGEELLKGKSGKIIVSAHFGNWEMTGARIAFKHKELIALAYRVKNKKLNQLITDIRNKAGIKIIYHDQPLKDFINALKEGKTISFLVDQNALRHRGVFVDFFGLPASTVTFPAKLAIKFDVPIFFAYSFFDDETKTYRGAIKRLDFSKTGKNEEDIKNLTQLYTKEIEKVVKEYPDQYFWIHKRWKTRPEGEPENIYK